MGACGGFDTSLNVVKSASGVQSIYKEATNLMKLRHKNIVELHTAFVEGHQLVMVMDYAGGGEVLEFVSKHGALKEDEARKIILQICNAIHYCHSRGVVHRDLKLENVLFRDKITEENRDLFVKIIDFGIAGICETGKQDKIDAGSIHYMPPECFAGQVVASAPSLDVWAIGLMFYSLLYGTLPFFSEDEGELIRKIKTEKLKFDKAVPVTKEARELIARMLERDVEKRLDLQDFVETQYYKYEEEEFRQLVAEYQTKYFEEQKEEAEARAVQGYDRLRVQSDAGSRSNASPRRRAKAAPGGGAAKGREGRSPQVRASNAGARGGTTKK